MFKDEKNMFIEKYKILVKQIRTTWIKGNTFHVHILEEEIHLKGPYHPKWPIDSIEFP